MNNPKLIQLIRESINEYIRSIDEAGENAALEAKMKATTEAIELREKKMNMDGLDEAYHDMLDKGKMKELGNEVKALKKSLAKYEKQLEKLKNKGEKVTKIEDTEEKEIVDEISIDDEVKEGIHDEDSPYHSKNKGKGRFTRGMDWTEEDFEKDAAKDDYAHIDALEKDAHEDKEDEKLDESFLHMQKLAGILSETEYKAKVEKAKKNDSYSKRKTKSFK